MKGKKTVKKRGIKRNGTQHAQQVQRTPIDFSAVLRENPAKMVYAFGRMLKQYSRVEPVTLEAPDGRKETLRGMFDRSARGYLASHSNFSVNPIKLLSEKIRAKKILLKPDSRIVSVGSGAGIHEVFLAKLCPQGMVVGVDYAHGMAKVAKGIAEKEHTSNVIFVQGDAEKIPVAKNSADIVLCIDTLAYIENWRDAVKQLSDTVKKTAESRVLITFTPDVHLQGKTEQVMEAVRNAGLEIVDEGQYENQIPVARVRDSYLEAAQRKRHMRNGQIIIPNKYIIAKPRL